MKQLYTCEAVEILLDAYEARGGTAYELEPGCLGYGLTVMTGDGLRTAVVREVYLNEWSSAHTVRFYEKMPKKYARAIERGRRAR